MSTVGLAALYCCQNSGVFIASLIWAFKIGIICSGIPIDFMIASIDTSEKLMRSARSSPVFLIVSADCWSYPSVFCMTRSAALRSARYPLLNPAPISWSSESSASYSCCLIASFLSSSNSTLLWFSCSIVSSVASHHFITVGFEIPSSFAQAYFEPSGLFFLHSKISTSFVFLIPFSFQILPSLFCRTSRIARASSRCLSCFLNFLVLFLSISIPVMSLRSSIGKVQ